MWHHRILEPVGRDMQVVQFVIIPSCQDQSRRVQPTTGSDLTGEVQWSKLGHSLLNDAQGHSSFPMAQAPKLAKESPFLQTQRGDGSDSIGTPHLPGQFPSPEQSERCLRISCEAGNSHAGNAQILNAQILIESGLPQKIRRSMYGDSPAAKDG